MSATEEPVINGLVSAVIPTHNRPDFVCRAVRSALEQTYRNIEVVVVVDGPDEPTLAALNELNDSRVRIVALEENVGGSEARNIGIREARGEFVALLDDDDEWLPEKTELQVKAFREHSSGSMIVVSQYLARSSDGTQICFPLRFPKPGQPVSEYMFAPFSGFQTSTFFFLRERALKIPFRTGLAGCQDLDWFLRASTALDAEIKVVSVPLAIFNIPENRPSTSRKLSWRTRLEWGRSCRSLMTPRGYSDFILRVCFEKMLVDGVTAEGLATVCREYLFGGRPTPSGVARIVANLVLPHSLKNTLRRVRQERVLASQGEMIR